MSGEPAIRKIIDRLYTWLDTHLGSGVKLFIDRPFDEPFRDEDLPYVNLRCDRTAYSVFDYGTMLHESALKFDIVSGDSSTKTNDELIAVIAATLNARMWAMDMVSGNIGELLQDKLPVSLGPEQDSFDGSDAGEMTFTWAVSYLTPLNDFCTINGQNGPVP